METKYPYNGKEFIVSKPEDGTMKVSLNGYTVVITLREHLEKYSIAFEGEHVLAYDENAHKAFTYACDELLRKLIPVSTKDKLCLELDTLYDKIRKSEI